LIATIGDIDRLGPPLSTQSIRSGDVYPDFGKKIAGKFCGICFSVYTAGYQIAVNLPEMFLIAVH
jgi:hypothetical protein